MAAAAKLEAPRKRAEGVDWSVLMAWLIGEEEGAISAFARSINAYRDAVWKWRKGTRPNVAYQTLIRQKAIEKVKADGLDSVPESVLPSLRALNVIA